MSERFLCVTALPLFLVAMLAGCKDGTGSNDDADTATDTPADTATDSALDTADDPSMDVPQDTGDDPDAPGDTGGETDADTDTDVASDLDATDVSMDGESDAASEPDSAPDATDDAGDEAYSHTIVIDGVNDFVNSDERFMTSSGGYWAWAAWDAVYLYLAMQGPNVGSGDVHRWVVVYLGGTPGTTTGVSYNTQQPGLPFPARWHVAWRCSNDLMTASEHTGAAWTDAAWDFTGDAYLTDNFVEMRIPLADIGVAPPAALDVVMYMVNDTDLFEWSYAAMPSSAFADGYDADFSHHFTFDLGATTLPADHAPI